LTKGVQYNSCPGWRFTINSALFVYPSFEERAWNFSSTEIEMSYLETYGLELLLLVFSQLDM